MLSSPSLRRPALAGLALLFMLGGCASSRPCFDNTEYLEARERPPTAMPAGVPGSERVGGTALVIPPAGPEPAKLDPVPRCLDQPPGFFRRVGVGGAAADSAEQAVNVWANAWANRKPSQVAAFYSPNFQTSEPGGATAFIEQRKQQVQTGKAPDAKLEEVTVNPVDANRRVVTFVQKFGDSRVRKELTLERDAQGWRIVAERTVEVL
jgi:hypothetical protein